MLSIVGNSDPTSILIHMGKLFDGGKGSTFSANLKCITGLMSSEQEAFACNEVVPVEGVVEN
jgi:dynein heavy chain